MGKRIAYMTWHHVKNYGTALQAFALKQTMEDLGHHVDLIDYNRSFVCIPIKRSVRTELQRLSRQFHKGNQEPLSRYDFPEEWFEEFYRKWFTYTGVCRYNQDFDVLLRQYDGFVCGSDQIWGPEWFDSRYFLDFVPESARKIAYAPSLGVSHIEQKEIADRMGFLIDSFANVSCRESSGCRLIEDISSKTEVQNVADPVLLFEKKKWEELVSERKIDEPYCILFFLKNNPAYLENARAHASKHPWIQKVSHCTQSEDIDCANLEIGTPFDFLSLIYNAEHVYTDSYHVFLFSLLFHKKVHVYLKDADAANNKGSRILDLFRMLELGKPIFGEEVPIDYAVLDRRMEQLRNESMAFLKGALDKIPTGAVYHQATTPECPCEGGCPRYSSSFTSRLQKSTKTEKKQLDRMASWGFTLHDSCYGCKLLDSKKLYNDKRPAFYEELQAKLDDRNIPLSKIFREYYGVYDTIRRVRERIGR